MVKVLISQTNVVGIGSIQTFPGSDNVRTIQFNPQVGQGFSGSVVIEGSFAASPGNNDFVQLLTVTFTGHTSNLVLEVQSNAPNLRARIATSQVGGIAVFADSADRAIQGSQGASPATAIVDSPNRVSGSGASFKINSVVVPSITSDDVVYANDFSLTVTDVLDGTNGATGKQDKIGNGVITANQDDINVLTGQAAGGLTSADMTKLSQVNASAVELNRMVGVIAPVQTQIDVLTASIPSVIAGLTVPSAQLNSFFNVAPVVNLSDLNRLDGLTASAADLNGLVGTASTFTAADLIKLGAITASAVELNKLSGFTGSVIDLNKLSGMTASTVDLNAITGLAGTGVTAAQLTFLNGLTENVQARLNALPALTGLTASVNDLNTFTGIFSGANGYPAPITAVELGYLNGLTSNVQNQLNARRLISTPIGIAEISGASITTSELNYLQGASGNIQAQIDNLSLTALTAAGGSLSGRLFIINGSAAAPGLGWVTPNNATGFYLFGANGIGLSVAGVSAMTLDGTDVQIGTATGSPNLKGVGFGVTDPAYGFTDDEDTGIYRVGANHIGIAAGAEVMFSADATGKVITIGGAAASNHVVTVPGIFRGEKLLGTGSVLAGTVTGAIGQTLLYTVPVGRSAVITKVLVRITNVDNFTSGALLRMNVGFGVAFDELVDNTTNVTIFNPGTYAFNTVGQVMPLGSGDNSFPAISGSAGADYQALTAGQNLRAAVTALAGADEFDMEVIVFGYEF